jgi:NTE family protein
MDTRSLPRPVGFVLGRGGSLGAVNTGILTAMGEHGVAPDLVAGTTRQMPAASEGGSR